MESTHQECTMTDFLSLTPRPPLRSGSQRWDVFLSYRSTNRPWVLALYDTLRQLGYEVFMDQYVLGANDRLAEALETHLAASATGVLIWSHQAADSQWCRREYYNFDGREAAQSGFRYVVVNVDGSDLPAFAQQKIWLDFRDLRDGAAGSNLLRLLYGLHDKPLPDEAVDLAAQVDEATRRALARIAAAKASGDSEGLAALAASTGVEWQVSALLGCKAAEALISLKANETALTTLEQLATRFPRSIRPLQLQGLALARLGNWRRAQQVLGELYALGERDPETVGMLARTWRDRYAQSHDTMHLRRARNLYAQAFESSPGNYYTGINAATNSLLLGEADEAERYAKAVEDLLGSKAKPGDYWATATCADVQLMRRRYAAAAALYAAAVTEDSEAKADHESTLAQARRLMDSLQPSAEERAAVERAFGAGGM
jgi:hypothetical protein